MTTNVPTEWDRSWLLLLLCDHVQEDHIRPALRRLKPGDPVALNLDALRETIRRAHDLGLAERAGYLEELGIPPEQQAAFADHFRQRTLEAVNLTERLERERFAAALPEESNS